MLCAGAVQFAGVGVARIVAANMVIMLRLPSLTLLQTLLQKLLHCILHFA